jgi:hypothetical protein
MLNVRWRQIVSAIGLSLMLLGVIGYGSFDTGLILLITVMVMTWGLTGLLMEQKERLFLIGIGILKYTL